MTLHRMDNVAIVVDDLDAAIAFFTELGLEPEPGGRVEIEGPWADQTVGIDGLRSEIAMLRVPNGNGRLELTKYHVPEAVAVGPPAPNTLGLHRVMYAVDDLEDTVARLRPLGAELVGEVTRIGDSYLLCYLRGPAGIVVALAEELGPPAKPGA